MGADSLAKNTPNAQEFICQICLPKPKSSEKRLHWASVVDGVREGTVLMQQAETTDGLHDKCLNQLS